MIHKQLKAAEHGPEWQGYSLEELNYQRAYTLARLEIQKQRLAANYHRVATSLNPAGRMPGIAGKIFSSLSVVDYGLMAFKMGKQIFSIFRRFRR